jgi:Glycine cleavage system protein P (pyridoxal-binding), N-terminal domain
MTEPAARTVYPYIPNSVPAIKAEMLTEVGAATTDELYDVIPASIRLDRLLNLPEPLLSEYDLRRHVEGLLASNRPTSEVLSFLGGGCWPHFVPAVCDEIASRGEFLTAYHDGERSMLGSYQAQFEFQSMIGELTGMQMVSTTTYDWGTSVASSLIMAAQVTGRNEVLLPRTISPTRLRQVRTICGPTMSIRLIDYERGRGTLDISALQAALSTDTAAVYIEVPSYLGFLEPRAPQIAELAHANGALFVVGVDPSSLGVLTGPGTYGADIVCGDLQPLGIHMSYGGGQAGFIATPHEERYIATCPTLLVSIVPTEHAGEYVFEWVNFEHISYGLRAESHDFAGTAQTIWAIVAGVYLSLMGPQGMRELGETIMQRGAYARSRLADVAKVVTPVFDAPHFKEFVVNYDRSSLSVAEINGALRARGIYGGKDLTAEFSELGKSALFCVTEIHRRDDIDRLADALAEVLR